VLGVVLFGAAGFFYTVASSQSGADPLVDHDMMSLGLRLTKGVSGWVLVAGVLGLFGGSKRDRSPGAAAGDRPSLMSRISSYTADAVLPIYVLHQTVIVLLAFYVVQWPVPGVVKYLIISLGSLVVIFVIYDVAVRRTRLTRFLFGMKPSER
jgi:hypothetical protein